MNLVTLAALVASILAGFASQSAAQGMVGGRTVATRPGFRYEGPLPAIRYLDIADDAGLAFRHVAASPARKEYIIETTGSGVALLDFDQDGLLDIFFVNGKPLGRGSFPCRTVQPGSSATWETFGSGT